MVNLTRPLQVPTIINCYGLIGGSLGGLVVDIATRPNGFVVNGCKPSYGD
jgi:hypothetical protein